MVQSQKKKTRLVIVNTNLNSRINVEKYNWINCKN